MAFKMRGYAYPGKSPVKQGKLGKGKNYESSKGDQQGPIPKNNIKLQPSENPDTYAYQINLPSNKRKIKKLLNVKLK